MPLPTRRTNGLIRRLFPILAVASFAAPAQAVVLYSSATRNTSPPGSLTNHGTGHTPGGPNDPRRLLNSGWQWQGRHGDFLGTPIAPQYYITAEHLGGASNFVLNGTTYTIDTSFNAGAGTPGWINDPNSDLRIWKINQTFPSWAPLYTEAPGSEVGRNLVVFGRGTQRGGEVRVNGELKGWQWGPLDGVQSWGENNVTSIGNAGPGFGLLMSFDFDADGGPNEAALTDHDSGGAVFVQSGGVWKLAGINFAVDGPWRYNQGDAAFHASIFDAGGLWVGNNPVFIPDGTTDVPGGSYSTLISSNLTWINSVIGASTEVPEPGVGLSVIALVLLTRRANRN